MAQSHTLTFVDPDHLILEVVESGVSGGETYQISPDANERFPKAGRIFRVSSKLISGAASTVTPQLSTTSVSFEPPYLVIKTSPKDEVDESRTGGVPYGLEGESLYHRSDPDAGSDNSVVTIYLIKRGWEN